MIREIAVVTTDSPYFREWALAAHKALEGKLPVVRATLDQDVDIGSPTLYLIIGDVDVGGIPRQVFRQLASGRQKRARLLLWYTERLPLAEMSCPESDERWQRFSSVHRAYDCVFGVDAGMVAFLRSQGVTAHHAPMGYDPLFERGLGPLPPLHDVLFNGEVNARRGEIISRVEERGLRVHVGFSQWGMARAYAMARSRCYLNLHYDDYPMFEQMRFLLGAANRIPIVSEHVAYPAPFIPGEHFLMSDPVDVPATVDTLLSSPSLSAQLTASAYDFVTQQVTMNRVVQQMLRDAETGL